MSITIDTSPTTQDGLSVLVQCYNNARLPADQLDGVNFNYSTPVTDPNSGNPLSAIVRVRPLVQTGIIGHIAMRYKRVSLSTLADYTHVASGALRVADIINSINERYGILLKEGDYNNANLPSAGNSVVVTIKPSCYLFTGQFTINVI